MSVIFRQLNELMIGLAQSLENSLLFPLDTVKGGSEELREHSKTVQNRVSLYQARLAKIAKHRPKDGAWSTSLTPADLATDMIEERTQVQAALAKFYLSYNRQAGRKGTELLDNIIAHFRMIQVGFRDGLKSTEECEGSVGALLSGVEEVKAEEDRERARLHQVEAGIEEVANRLAPARPGSAEAALVSRPSTSNNNTLSGTLWKKSRFGQWQRRDHCRVQGPTLFVPHSDGSQPPMEIRLTMCGVGIAKDDARVIQLQARHSPKAHREFQAEDEATAARWVMVMKNAQNRAFEQVEPESRDGLVGLLRNRPGNNACADCSATKDVSWISTNLGVLLCIGCAGIHRELGVQVSRTQSLTLDTVHPRELIPALAIGNTRLNSLLAARPRALQPAAPTAERQEFIRAKYLGRAMVSGEPRSAADAVADSDPASLVLALLAAPAQAKEPDLLQQAVAVEESLNSVAVVEILLINGADARGTQSKVPLVHWAVERRRGLYAKLLLARAKGVLDEKGRSPIDVATELDPSMATMLSEVEVSEGEVRGLVPGRRALLPSGLGSSTSSIVSNETRTGSIGSTRGPTPPPASVKPIFRAERSGSLMTAGNGKAAHRRSQSEGLTSSLDVSHDLMPNTTRAPAPPPRAVKASDSLPGRKRCRALFDCRGDQPDELSFRKGELILVTRTRLDGEDPAWMEGHIMGEASRKGIFPTSFVTFEAI